MVEREDIHIGLIQSRHDVEGQPFTDYIWGEHLVDEGIMEWATRTNFKTGEEEEVLNLVDPFDTSTHRRVAGEWITQTVLRHRLIANNIVENCYKVKVILHTTGGISQIKDDFTSSWTRLTGNDTVALFISYHNFKTGEYQEVHWP